jgi:hypothetical protein
MYGGAPAWAQNESRRQLIFLSACFLFLAGKCKPCWPSAAAAADTLSGKYSTLFDEGLLNVSEETRWCSNITFAQLRSVACYNREVTEFKVPFISKVRNCVSPSKKSEENCERAERDRDSLLRHTQYRSR